MTKPNRVTALTDILSILGELDQVDARAVVEVLDRIIGVGTIDIALGWDAPKVPVKLAAPGEGGKADG